MADFGYQVIEYDGSIAHSPYTHPNITFHKKFVASKNSDSTITLESLLNENQLEDSAENILQIDIENVEWEMLEGIDIGILARYFTQVIFEFHGCNPEEEQGFQRRITQLKRLNEHFTPIHLHLNNHGKIFYSKSLFFSTSLEVSYCNNKIMHHFKANQKLEKGILQNLDSPTWVSNPEIPIRFL